MATKKSTSPARASERRGFDLDLRSAALRDMMTEQCRQKDGWATFYNGTQAQFVAAGVPEYVFPQTDRPVKLRINAERDAFLARKNGGFEFSVLWDYNGPWYHSAAHPALTEIARMVLIHVGQFLDTGDTKPGGFIPTDELPLKRLIDCPAAVDYRLPSHKRFQLGPTDKSRIGNALMRLHREIQVSEIMPIVPPVVPYDEQDEGDVVNLDKARAALRQFEGRRKPPRKGAKD